MIPKCKILTYTGAVLDYTLEDIATSVHIRDVLNDVGTFNFVLPTVKGLPSEGYQYGDIALYDKAYFYFWDAETASCPANPQFIGRITKIGAPVSIESGYYRVFEGKLLTEILTRRFKRNKSWVAIDAHEIVDELCDDLSLGKGDVAADTTHVTMHVDVDSYIDVLRKVSDYWYDAGNQIKKDFYVDVDNDLVWKARPIRTAGVETLTVGTNIQNYHVMRDIESVKNYITVFGTNGTNAQEGRCEPSDHDAWTWGDVWTDFYGTSASSVAHVQYGATSVLLSSEDVGADEYIKSMIIFSTNMQGMGRSGYQTLKFYVRRDIGGAVPVVAQVRLETSTNNYFYRSIVTESSALAFTAVNSDLGDSQEYHATLNPNGVWQKTGTPDWYNIDNITFYFSRPDNTGMYFYVDALYFSKGRYRNNTSNAASITSYGQRDLDVIDDNLKSDAECQSRSEALLYQLKDAPIRIDVLTPGNMNILIGDQLTAVIPAESINGTYDVISVTHDYSKNDFKTNVSMVNSSNIRQLPSGTPLETIQNKIRFQKDIGKGLNIIT